MKYTLYSMILTLALQASAQVNADSCRYTCKPVRLWEYKVGDAFIFPGIPKLMQTDPAVPEYQIQTGMFQLVEAEGGKKEMKFVPKKSRVAHYQDVAGKKFEVTAIQLDTAASYKDSNYEFLVMNLWGGDSTTQLSFRKVFNKTEAEQEALAHPLENNLTLPWAVYEPEFIQAIQQLGSLKTLYILESPIDKSKYEPVTISKIDVGTWETPVRIEYRVNADETGKIYVKDVSLCGTNALGAFQKNFHFSVFFSCHTNPIGAEPATWELIRKGKISRNMNHKEVEFALGKLQKVRSAIVQGDKLTIYQSGDWKLTFENDVLTDIK